MQKERTNSFFGEKDAKKSSWQACSIRRSRDRITTILIQMKQFIARTMVDLRIAHNAWVIEDLRHTFPLTTSVVADRKTSYKGSRRETSEPSIDK